MFAAPLGLLGLLALPAILALHLFKRRYRPKIVSALFLWGDGQSAPTSGRNREPLKRNLSLLLELLAALLLTLALAGPRLKSPGSAEHLVLVLDGTASMQAIAPDDLSALDRAREVALTAIDGVGSDGRVTIIRSGPEPTLIAGPLAFPAEAKDALGALECTHPSADAGAAFDLATEIARGADILYLTDQPRTADSAPQDVRVQGVGVALGNVGIVSALRSPEGTDNGTELLRLAIRSFSSSTESREITIRSLDASADPLFQRPVSLAAGAGETVQIQLPQGTPTLRVELTRAASADPFALDDVAVLAAAPARRLRLYSDLPDAAARALGLADSERAAERWAALIPAADVVADPASAHLTLGTGLRKEETPEPSAWSIVLRSPTEDPVHLIGPFLMDRAHPLLAGITLDGVVWSCFKDDAARGAALVLSGSRALLSEEISPNGRRRWDLALDATQSTLGRSADWPIFLANAAEARRAELPGPVRTSLASSESFRWRGAPEGDWALLSPSGAESKLERIPSGDLFTRRLNQIGTWQLIRDGERQVDVGVSLLSADESDLRLAARLAPEPAAPRSGTSSSGGRDMPIVEILLAAGAALAMLLNWWIVRPRSNQGSAA